MSLRSDILSLRKRGPKDVKNNDNTCSFRVRKSCFSNKNYSLLCSSFFFFFIIMSVFALQPNVTESVRACPALTRGRTR